MGREGHSQELPCAWRHHSLGNTKYFEDVRGGGLLVTAEMEEVTRAVERYSGGRY